MRSDIAAIPHTVRNQGVFPYPGQVSRIVIGIILIQSGISLSRGLKLIFTVISIDSVHLIVLFDPINISVGVIGILKIISSLFLNFCLELHTHLVAVFLAEAEAYS